MVAIRAMRAARPVNASITSFANPDGRRILADRIEQHRLAELRRRLSENVNVLGFKEIEVAGLRGHHAAALQCKPHSLPKSLSHHQRPARMSSPGPIARVQGSQPIDGKPFACSGFKGMACLAT